MNKKFLACLLCVFCVCAAGGCAKKADGGADKKTEYVSKAKVSTKELQKEYPQWIDSNGAVVYPYTIESEEYVNADSWAQQCSLMDIPKDVVDSLDTAALLKAVEEYPMGLDYFRFNSIGDAHENYRASFYGYGALLGREDAYDEAYKLLKERIKDDFLKSCDYNSLQDDEHLDKREEVNKMILEFSLILTKQGWDGLDDADRETVEEQATLLIKVLGPVSADGLVSGGDWDITS